MKWKFLLQIFCMAFVIALFSECKYGVPGPGELPGDTDSDRPEWAGSGKNKPDPGTSGGQKDFGDMVVLYRDVDGVPIMDELPVRDEDGNIVDEDGNDEPDEYFWVYQPMYVTSTDEFGNFYDIIPLDQYGEVPPDYSVVEVDFGRLNIVRSPESVLNQALGEVLTAMGADETVPYSGYTYTQDFCGRLSIWKDGVFVKTIDSPRESMAIYREIMKNEGGWGELDDALNGSGINALELAAASFAAGSDKTGNVDVDEVEYVNGMMKIEGDPTFKDDVGKTYFNFVNFNYNRATAFSNRCLIFYDFIDGQYIENHRESVYLAMETRGLFRYRYSGGASNVDGFACAIDDAVQVLEFVHGNSNIEFDPECIPPAQP